MTMRDLNADREDRNRKMEIGFIVIEVEAAPVKALALGKLPGFWGFEMFFGPGWMQDSSVRESAGWFEGKNQLRDQDGWDE